MDEQLYETFAILFMSLNRRHTAMNDGRNGRLFGPFKG